MSRNIVICLDGTWNKPDEPDDSESSESNVRILYEMCLEDGANQVKYYDTGVGTKWYDDKIGGITGAGLSRNVRQAYRWLTRQFEKGDKVFIFGFSRGAYTARSLAGLLWGCGLLPPGPDAAEAVDRIYEHYRGRDEAGKRACKAANRACPVEMIGVWDTVGALGIPTRLLPDPTARRYQFHDVRLNPEVRSAYHALALDEARATFEATLWQVGAREPGQVVEQVWFAGAHSDVGGGYAERHHSDVALHWMVTRATQRGLLWNDHHGHALAPDLSQPNHDSYRKLFGPRRDRTVRVMAENTPWVHASVLEQMRLQPDYRPPALVDLQDPASLAPYRIVSDE